MALEIPNVRPAVISEKTREQLDPYRGFRHVVRNVYTYHISPDKMKPLANGIRPVFKQVEKELAAFSRFNQMVLKALRIVAIGRKSSSALSGKGMKPN
jgi:hypothetical protein